MQGLGQSLYTLIAPFDINHKASDYLLQLTSHRSIPIMVAIPNYILTSIWFPYQALWLPDDLRVNKMDFCVVATGGDLQPAAI
jgi:hypothetical protein